MKKKFFRFLVAYMTISLVAVNFVFFKVETANATETPTTVYVNSTWTEGSVGDGLTWGQTAFSDIDTAITAVATGGTVYLLDSEVEGSADFVLENVVNVNKAVSIIGEDLDEENNSVSEDKVIVSIKDSTVYMAAGNNCKSAICVSTSSVNILNIELANDGSLLGGSSRLGIIQVSTTTSNISNINILNNKLTNVAGLDKVRGSGILLDAVSNVVVSENEISGQGSAIYFADLNYTDEHSFSNVSISNNDIVDNSTGVEFDLGYDNYSDISITGNEITGSYIGLNLDDLQFGHVVINGNKIYGNDWGLDNWEGDTIWGRWAVSADSTINKSIDLSKNWWGSEFGPNVYVEYNSCSSIEDTGKGGFRCSDEAWIGSFDTLVSGSGDDDVNNIIINAGSILNTDNPAKYINSSFRPFYIDSELTTLSDRKVTISEEEEDSLSILFTDETFGTMNISSDDVDETDSTKAKKVKVAEKLDIEIPSTGVPTTTISLPADTEITKADNGYFEYQDLSAAEMATNALSGFESGELIGALQWGIPSVGLVFSSPVTIEMYVGTELAGQVLELYRSVSTNGGWTKDGLEGIGAANGKCLVSETGMCKFNTTKASYFGVLKASSSDDDDDSSSGSSAPITLPAGIGSGARDVSGISIGAALHAGEINGDGVNFLTYATNQNHFISQDSSSKREKTNHHFVINSLDLNTEIASIVFYSEPKTISIKKGETKDLDLDGDKINDIKVIFSNIYVNRAEITVKSLSNTSPVVSEPSNTSTVEIIKITNDAMYNKLKGKIILKVEDNGRAYYVSPVKKEMYYLGRPTDAFSVMRSQGVGITNSNLEKVLKFGEKISLKVSKLFSKKQAGKIFLQVESKGEAWYIDNDGNRHFLGRPNDAFSVMKSLGLGISNANFSSMSK